MFVDRLELINFRNYGRQALELSPRVNIFTGGNGMGKTNLLEAVYFCSIGRSPRTPRDRELILWNEERAKVFLRTQKSEGDESVEIIISKNENKRVLVNGIPVSRIGELMGAVATVFFSPTELKVVQGAPGERRSFIDIALCQISRAYFYLLTRYNKTLAQRNRLLKSGQATRDTLAIWDGQLAHVGAKVIKTRKGFIKSLAPLAKGQHLYLSGGQEDLQLCYEGLAGETAEELEELFLKELQQNTARDMKVGFTHTGPHKDDVSIKIGNTDIRTFGSQGQQRTAALSLKLSELELAKLTKSESPVLLLDDVLSELDPHRQLKLLERVQGFQTLITCTHLEPFAAEFFSGTQTEFKVREGCVV